MVSINASLFLRFLFPIKWYHFIGSKIRVMVLQSFAKTKRTQHVSTLTTKANRSSDTHYYHNDICSPLPLFSFYWCRSSPFNPQDAKTISLTRYAEVRLDCCKSEQESSAPFRAAWVRDFECDCCSIIINWTWKTYIALGPRIYMEVTTLNVF